MHLKHIFTFLSHQFYFHNYLFSLANHYYYMLFKTFIFILST